MRFVGLFVAGIILVVLWNFVASYDKQERYFQIMLRTKIDQGEDKIYLRELTNFKWDKVLLTLTDYDATELKDLTKIEYDGTIPSNWCDPYQKADLIFIDEDTIRIIDTGYCNITSICTDTNQMWIKDCSTDPYLTIQNKQAHGESYNQLTINKEGLNYGD